MLKLASAELVLEVQNQEVFGDRMIKKHYVSESINNIDKVEENGNIDEGLRKERVILKGQFQEIIRGEYTR